MGAGAVVGGTVVTGTVGSWGLVVAAGAVVTGGLVPVGTVVSVAGLLQAARLRASTSAVQRVNSFLFIGDTLHLLFTRTSVPTGLNIG